MGMRNSSNTIQILTLFTRQTFLKELSINFKSYMHVHMYFTGLARKPLQKRKSRSTQTHHEFNLYDLNSVTAETENDDFSQSDSEGDFTKEEPEEDIYITETEESEESDNETSQSPSRFVTYLD